MKNSLEEKGMDFRMEAQTADITGNGRVSGVNFADGTSLQTDLVVMAVGIRPNMELAQQAGLYGVEKEVLPKIWKDLNDAGMVSGHAYGKAMRTVKTCVGKQWCRFGTQDSTVLGIKLEELIWASWMPHKFKLAVSGCPRNCAEATIKDFGMVCVDSGYELHIGGNGGIKVRTTDLLCNVSTEEEVLEYCAAFIQFYREDAHYLEPRKRS